jgi:hypothetical protein
MVRSKRSPRKYVRVARLGVKASVALLRATGSSHRGVEKDLHLLRAHGKTSERYMKYR